MSEKPWWQEEGPRAGEVLAGTVQELATSEEQLDREDRYLRYAQLYCNQSIKTLREWRDHDESGDSIGDPQWSYNVCKAGTDTMVSLVARTPRIQILANGGTRQMRKKAEMMTRYLDGLHWMVKYRKLSRRRFRDSSMFDIGFLRWVPHGSQLRCERRFPWQILWHADDARDGEPTCLYDCQRVPVHVVLARHPRLTEEERAKVKQSAVNGKVWLDEAWQQPLDDCDDDVPDTVNVDRVVANGRHMAHCGGVVLTDEHWPHQYFPVVGHVYDERAEGWSGQGTIEQLLPYQAEIHRVLNTMRTNHRIASVLRIAMEKGTQLDGTMLSNEPATTLSFKKTPPQFFVADAKVNEFLGMAKEIYQMGLESIGIGEQAASGRKEPGITAAAAIQELRDIQTARFRPHVEAYDETAAEDAMVAMAESRKMYEGNKKLRVQAPGTEFLDEIEWGKIDFREDAFIARPQPTGSLPLEPAARRQIIEDRYNKGVINRLQYLEGLADADPLAQEMMELAPLRRVDRAIDAILDDGNYETPDEYIPHDLAIRRGYQAISRAEDEKVASDRVALLRQWLDEVARLGTRVSSGGGVSPGAAAATAIDQAAATSQAAAGGVVGANPAGAPLTPTAPAMPPTGGGTPIA